MFASSRDCLQSLRYTSPSVTSLTRSTLKVVAIGGGTGLSTLLRGLKPYTTGPGAEVVDLTAIVTVTDDGKSSGRLRDEFDILPPGDIRNCLTALADENSIISQLFKYRFPGDGAVGGHSLGNLMLLGLAQIKGNFLEGIETARDMLNIDARVLPSTLDRVSLVARVGKSNIHGQVAIKSQAERIDELMLKPADAHGLPKAIDAIEDAHLITIGPGSLFTSVIANLLISDIRNALIRSSARKIYICNVMTEADETHRFRSIDHLKEIKKYAPGLKFDYSLFNSSPISGEMRERYAEENAVVLDPPTSADSASTDVRLVSLPLASEERFVRHDPWRLSKAILDLYNDDVSSHRQPLQTIGERPR